MLEKLVQVRRLEPLIPRQLLRSAGFLGSSAANLLIYLSTSLLLALVALLAIAVPSSRATRIDPLVALRDS